MKIDAHALGLHVAELARGYIDRKLAEVEPRFVKIEAAQESRAMPDIEPLRKDVAALVSREAPNPVEPLERFANALTARLLA